MEPSVEWVTRAPCGPLRALIDRYVGYRLPGSAPATHRGLPARHLTLIVSIGAPVEVPQQTSPSQPSAGYRAVLSGMQANEAHLTIRGEHEGVLIELSPVGCRALFHLPAGAVRDLSVEFSDVVGPVGDQMWARMQDTSRWSERFDICDDVLLARLAEPAIPAALDRCWRGLVETGGRLPVASLARVTGYSRQHLTRTFRREFGMGPKLAARVVRFDRAQRALRSSPALSVAEIAAACGFADQSHMARDFAALAGCSPRDLRAAATPGVEQGCHRRWPVRW